jgi:hypothetical protein
MVDVGAQSVGCRRALIHVSGPFFPPSPPPHPSPTSIQSHIPTPFHQQRDRRTSSNRITLYGRRRTASVSCPPSSCPMYPGGDPIMRATVCCSMYSDMSSRIMFFSSSNSSRASCFEMCVLPTPVGPRKRKLPMGRVLVARPARARMMASATALTAGSCPITCFFSRSSSPSTRSRSPWLSLETGMPVQRETTAATCSGPTKSCNMALPPFFTSSSLAA